MCKGTARAPVRATASAREGQRKQNYKTNLAPKGAYETAYIN